MASAGVYTSIYKEAFSGNVNWLSHDIKCMLCTSSYSPQKYMHSYKSSVTGEVTGSGYTSGGISLTGKTITQNISNMYFDCADIVWNNANVTARYGVVYDATATNQPLICYIDFGTDQVCSNANFTITIDSNGLFSLTS